MLGTAEGKIHLLLGSNHAKLFSSPVHCKDLGPFHRIPWLEGISFFKTPFNDRLEFHGPAGINTELFDSDYPNFVIPKLLVMQREESVQKEKQDVEEDLPEQMYFRRSSRRTARLY